MILIADIVLLVEGAVCLVVGAGIGYWIVRWKDKSVRKSAQTESESLLENARREAESLKREVKLVATEEALKQREQNEQLLAARRRELADTEDRLARRENILTQQLENISQKEKNLESQKIQCEQKQQALDTQKTELARTVQQRIEQLEKISHLSETAAREELLRHVQQDAEQEAGTLSRRIIEDAKNYASEKARQVVSIAIQRYAGSHISESTTATITLPGDEIKGRIIGREGRNIRAFENATGVTVLIDDTPNAVVLSGFDPVRREIAREAMSRLIQDGRIHPTRIEEVVAKVTQEMDDAIIRHGEEALQRTGLAGLDRELVRTLGRLHYRHSFTQNILAHSIEVAHIMGLMAAEMGLDITVAKRAGLLHDIGKAVDHEVEGAHAIVGAELIKRHGESDQVVTAVASHHGDIQSDAPISALLAAADAISASRPGARSETMTTYLRRVEDLERIGASFPGVEKCFAVQAGRELRVLVFPEQVTDEQSFTLSRNIARKIEESLQYPGQIRVVVMRETRNVEFAK